MISNESFNGSIDQIDRIVYFESTFYILKIIFKRVFLKTNLFN